MTQVSWKRQLMLAIALFALGTFAYWLEFKHKPQTEEKEAATKKLFEGLKETPVESIRVSSGTKSYLFTCQDFAAKQCKPGDNSKWDLAEPTRLRGDDANVNTLLGTLNTTEASDTIDLKDETPEKRAALLKDYGLDAAARSAPGARRIEVKTSAGETIIYFGGTHPIGEGIFSAVEKVPSGAKTGTIDETRVLLVPSYFKNNLEHDLTYWRDKKILSVHDTDIASFSIDAEKTGKISASRSGGEWMLDSAGESYLGDSEAVNTFLNGVSFLTAKEFASEKKDDPQAKALLKGTKPVLTLVLQENRPQPKPSPSGTPTEAAAEAPEPITITFLARAAAPVKLPPGIDKKAAKNKPMPPISKLYVTVSNKDPLYEVDTYAKDRFEKGLKDLRMSKLMSSMDRFTAKRMEFSGEVLGAGPPLTLISSEGQWRLSSDPKKEIDTSKAQGLLDKMSTSKIRDFLKGTAIPTGQDKGLRMAIGDEKTPTKKQILFWRADGRIYARDLDSPKKEAFLLDAAFSEALPWQRDFFKKSATPAPTPTGAPPVVKGGLPPGLNLNGMHGMQGLPTGHPPISGNH